MKVKEQNAPVLRFPGFSEDWNIDRIKNYISRVGVPVNVEPGKLYREIGIRSHGKGLFHKEPVTGKSLGNKRVFKVHVPAFVVNIVFAWEHAIAVTSDNEKGFIASHRFPMFVPVDSKSTLPFVRYFFLRKYGKHLLGLASPGGAGRNKTLGQKNFDKLKVIFPEVGEQQQIASFLTAVDSKIEQLSKKKALLKQYKKGIMQKIFSQELRFKDEQGNEFPDWKEKRLGEIASNISYGLNCAAVKFDSVNKYIRITDIDDSSRKYIPKPLSSPAPPFDESYLVKKGDILFARTGASVGKSYLYNEKDGRLFFAGFLIRFSIKHANPYFIFSQTLSVNYRKWVKVVSMRSGQPGINAEEFKTYKLVMPSIEEQKKIADFLSSIDKKINLISTELNHAQSFKKSLLQQMFI